MGRPAASGPLLSRLREAMIVAGHGGAGRPEPARWVIVDRRRIVQLLIYHHGERGTVIHAPAGWGKTIACRQWWDAAGDATGGGGVSLTLRSEPAARTWVRIRDGLAGSGSVAAATRPEPAGIASALAGVNRPTFVRLDDFHRADEPLAAGLADLVAATPRWVNVVLVTRTEPPGPVAALVNEGAFRTVTSTELAFRPKEVAELWAKAHGAVPGDRTVEEILDTTAGRPADVHDAVLGHAAAIIGPRSLRC